MMSRKCLLKVSYEGAILLRLSLTSVAFNYFSNDISSAY